MSADPDTCGATCPKHGERCTVMRRNAHADPEGTDAFADTVGASVRWADDSDHVHLCHGGDDGDRHTWGRDG